MTKNSLPVDYDVMIVGAGPIGMTLALDLGLRGINVILIDSKLEPLRLPKMERSNPRTMEIFRRLGVIDQIRAAGYPAEVPMDVMIVTSMADPPLVQQNYPSVAAAREQIAACNDGSMPREPYQLISQYTLEPLLLAQLKTLANVTIRFGMEFVKFQQDEEGVKIDATVISSGETESITARYLVACDGASSSVRRQLGIKMEGRAQLGTVTNVFFCSDDLYEKAKVPAGRHYCFAGLGAGGGAAGTLIVQDDRKHFAYHTITPPTGDLADELRRLTGLDIEPEILHAGQWVQHMMVAERHSEGRVFLAGDANHIFIPAGGLGMNTGIGDAVNLAWKLAAVLQGWGGPELLKTYDIERGAVARRNLSAVAHAVEGVAKWRGTPISNEIRLDTPEGVSMREAFRQLAEPLNRRVYEMVGADLGYVYRSSIVLNESGEKPPDDHYAYHPTTWPGAHLPHVWLKPGVALYDFLGTGFTLLRLGNPAQDGAPLAKAFKDKKVPFEIIDIDIASIREVFQRNLILVRPDLHVVWRGNVLPQNAEQLVDIAIGNIDAATDL